MNWHASKGNQAGVMAALIGGAESALEVEL